MSPLMSWLSLAVAAVIAVGLASMVRLVVTALGNTRWVRRLDAWAEVEFGSAVSWNPDNRAERRAGTRRSARTSL